MSILIDENTKVIVQGISGRIGQFHAEDMIKQRHQRRWRRDAGQGRPDACWAVPVFNTMKGAVARKPARPPRIVFVPPPFAADAIMEAADAGIRYCVCMTDGIPAQDMIRVKRFMRRYKAENRMILTGPNCAGTFRRARR
jgi:malate-CoA ligase subunit alpha